MHTAEQLVRDLGNLGIRPGDAVFMHSSYRSLGGVEDGAEGFFAAFFSLLGPEGTLLLPAFTYDSVTRENPRFDYASSPSCVGYLSEYFRTKVPGVVRSLHPTHSCCAAGGRARELTGEHHLDRTPVGPFSPLGKLPRIGGKILILGSHPDQNTSLHGVEETAEPEYLFDRSAPIVYTVTDDCGRTSRVTHLRHGFHFPHADYAQRYSRILGFLSGDEFRRGRVLDADCVLMDAEAVWRKGRAALLRDPLCFVDVLPK